MVRPGDRVQPKLAYDIKVKIFDTGSPAELSEYEAVLDRVGRGRAIISKEDARWVESKGAWKILLRWMEPYYTMAATEVRSDADKSVR